MYVLDKMEAAFASGLMLERRWADETEILCMLSALKVRALKISPADVDQSCWWPYGQRVTSIDVSDGHLRQNCADVVFLHWSEVDPVYQHYATVSYCSESAWRCSPALRDASARAVQALPTEGSACWR